MAPPAQPERPAVSGEARDLRRRRRQALTQSGHGSSAYKDLNRVVRSVLRRRRLFAKPYGPKFRNVRGVNPPLLENGRGLNSISTSETTKGFETINASGQ